MRVLAGKFSFWGRMFRGFISRKLLQGINVVAIPQFQELAEVRRKTHHHRAFSAEPACAEDDTQVTTERNGSSTGSVPESRQRLSTMRLQRFCDSCDCLSAGRSPAREFEI